MVTHEEAMDAADTIRDYCKENFKGNEKDCVNCIFHNSENRRCILKYAVGLLGEEMYQWAGGIVRKRYMNEVK